MILQLTTSKQQWRKNSERNTCNQFSFRGARVWFDHWPFTLQQSCTTKMEKHFRVCQKQNKVNYAKHLIQFKKEQSYFINATANQVNKLKANGLWQCLFCASSQLWRKQQHRHWLIKMICQWKKIKNDLHMFNSPGDLLLLSNSSQMGSR